MITTERGAKISKALKGKGFTTEHREAIAMAKKGKKLTEEHKEAIRSASPLKKQVKCIETGKSYESQTEAERDTGISKNLISRNCHGKILSAGGFHWEFVK